MNTLLWTADLTFTVQFPNGSLTIFPYQITREFPAILLPQSAAMQIEQEAARSVQGAIGRGTILVAHLDQVGYALPTSGTPTEPAVPTRPL